MIDFSYKTVLITGATGLIGSNLAVSLLENKNCTVICVCRNKEKMERVFRKFLKNTNFVSIITNDFNFLKEIKYSVDFIFHAAGPISGSFIQNNPVEVINPNIFGLYSCIDFLKEQKKGKLIVFSSATIYKNITNCDKSFTEDESMFADSLNSCNAPYSETKRMCEVIALAFAKEYHVDISIVRLGYVYGPCEFIPKTAFFSFLRSAISNENIELQSSKFTKRDNIYIMDAVRGLLFVAKLGKTGEIYNIASNGDKDNYASIVELAREICNVHNKLNNTKIINIRFKENDTTYLPGVKLENCKLKSLGWDIEYNLANGIYETYCYYCENKELIQ